MRITDLGLARVWNPENSKDTSGTPGYMAPEVMEQWTGNDGKNATLETITVPEKTCENGSCNN